MSKTESAVMGLGEVFFKSLESPRIEDAIHQAKNLAEKLKTQFREDPIRTSLATLAVGYTVGRLLYAPHSALAKSLAKMAGVALITAIAQPLEKAVAQEADLSRHAVG